MEGKKKRIFSNRLCYVNWRVTFPWQYVIMSFFWSLPLDQGCGHKVKRICPFSWSQRNPIWSRNGVKENSLGLKKRQQQCYETGSTNYVMVDVIHMNQEILLPQRIVGWLYLPFFCKGWSSVSFANGDKEGNIGAVFLRIYRIRPALLRLPLGYFQVRSWS